MPGRGPSRRRWQSSRPLDGAAWRELRAEARADYEAWQQPVAHAGLIANGRGHGWLGETLPQDAIIANGAGNYAIWVHSFYRFRQFGTQLAPTSGSMGYGVPAAVAAKLLRPTRTVVAFAGDGCFLMTGQEFATAMQYNAGDLHRRE